LLLLLIVAIGYGLTVIPAFDQAPSPG